MDLKEAEILGGDVAGHWYYRSKAAAMLRLLGGRAPRVVLDVGAGSAFFSRQLLSHTTARQAWCVDPGYATDHDAEHASKPLHFRRSIGATDADLVLLMDVLEHVEDDAGLLAQYARLAPKGARFLVSVPAFGWLWSEHDEFLGHRRRYTLPQLEGVARNAGLRVTRGAYFFGFAFPIAVATRVAGRVFRRPGQAPRSQLRAHGKVVNQLLAWAGSAELAVLHSNRLAGLTAFCLAES